VSKTNGVNSNNNNNNDNDNYYYYYYYYNVLYTNADTVNRIKM